MTAPLRLTERQAEVLQAIQDGRDPEIFATKVLGVRLNPAQRRWFSLVRPQENGWEWRLKAVLHVAANQIGKTLGLAILILWACWNKIGVPTDDMDRWLNAPYVWFHLAPTQPQAYLPLLDMKLLLEGNHPAQKGECLIPRGLIQEVKIEQYYDGLSLWNGAMVQFRTTDDKAKALQGRRAAGISYDEAAFEAHLKSVVNETLFMRLIASGGPLWLVSTPNGINDWYEIVTSVQETAGPRRLALEGEPLAGGSCRIGELIPIWENAEGWGLVWSTVEDNIGFGISGTEAQRMERDLDPATKEQQLRGAFLEPAEAYFVPSQRIALAFRNLPERVAPEPDHLYVISWDPSDTTDPAAVIVLDVTKKPWRGVYFEHFTKPLGETLLLSKMFELHAYYNGGATPRRRGQQPPRAVTVFDSTSMGGSMIRNALAKLTPKVPLNLAGPTTKRDLLSNCRAALNALDLVLPTAWTQVRREVLTYKLPDDKIRQDCVMALIGAAGVAAKGFSGVATQTFRLHGRVAPRI